MAAPYSDLASKVEEACLAVVTATGASVTLNAGLTVDELLTPYCVCACVSAGEEVVRNTGIYRVSVQIMVVSSADDSTLANHRSLVATIFDAFQYDTVEATLSAAVSDFHVYDVFYNGFESSVEERKLINQLNVDMVCCASDIS